MRELNNKKNQIYICIDMDLSKAFDKLIMICMNKLNYHGIDGIEFQWFRSYLTNRSQYVTVYNYRNARGFNTWPIIYVYIYICIYIYIYMNDIPDCSSLFSFLLYADDTSLVSYTNINDGDTSYSPISIINSELAKVTSKVSSSLYHCQQI